MLRLSRRNLALYAADQLEAGKTEVVEQLAAYLVATRRTKEAELLVRDIEKALEKRGTVVAHVASAYALDETQKAEVEALLKKRYDAQRIAVDTIVDEHLLGGIVIGTANDEFDGSLRRNINRLKSIKV